MNNLKPCAFCGGQVLLHSRGEVGNLHWIYCKTCRSEGPVAMDLDEAIGLWNHRVLYDYKTTGAFGPEWENEMMKWNKKRLISQIKAEWSAKNDGWNKFPDIKPKDQQLCIVAGGPGMVAQIIPLRWNEKKQEFTWHEDSDGLQIDDYPTEISTHWIPWPDDPQ